MSGNAKKYIKYIDLIKKYAETMTAGQIALELEKTISNEKFTRVGIRSFCVKNNIKCLAKKICIKQAKKIPKPKKKYTPEERKQITSERKKLWYLQNKEKVKERQNKIYHSKKVIKQQRLLHKKINDDALIEEIKSLAENKCVEYEKIRHLNLSQWKITSICKKIGYFYIKPYVENPVHTYKPIEKKIKVRKQSKLFAHIEQIKLQAKKLTISEMAEMLEVNPATLYNFCKNHKIKAVSTVRSQHEKAKNRDNKVYEMLQNGICVEDIMKEFNITHKQYYNYIYRVARDNNILHVIKFNNRNEFKRIRKGDIALCHNEIKPIINNILEYSEDNTRFVIRNTRTWFR